MCVQIVAMFVSFSFLWPTELKTVFTSISFFSFNIQIIAPEVCLPHAKEKISSVLHPPRADVRLQCSIEWTYTTKFMTIALMPVAAVVCSFVTAILIKIKNLAVQEWQLKRNVPLSEPTDIQALWGLLLAANYYLYLQVCHALRLSGCSG